MRILPLVVLLVTVMPTRWGGASDVNYRIFSKWDTEPYTYDLPDGGKLDPTVFQDTRPKRLDPSVRLLLRTCPPRMEIAECLQFYSRRTPHNQRRFLRQRQLGKRAPEFEESGAIAGSFAQERADLLRKLCPDAQDACVDRVLLWLVNLVDANQGEGTKSAANKRSEPAGFDPSAVDERSDFEFDKETLDGAVPYADDYAPSTSSKRDNGRMYRVIQSLFSPDGKTSKSLQQRDMDLCDHANDKLECFDEVVRTYVQVVNNNKPAKHFFGRDTNSEQQAPNF